MEQIRIDSTAHPHFGRMWEIYRNAFPEYEQRSWEGQEAAFRYPNYRVDAWTENGKLLGFLAWWDLPDLIYIEHFAMAPEKRGGGIGGRVLSAFLRQHPGTVVLDIDPVTDEISTRRKGFYERLGFRVNPHRHIHPPYQGNGDLFELVLMSTPRELTPETYRDFHGKLKEIIAIGR